MVQYPIITLDCDWAPDFVISYVAKILSDKGVKATWFVTNESPVLEDLRKNHLFELGIHPNFGANSTQGIDPDSILTNLKKIVPTAKSVRSHSLIQSSHLIAKFHKYEIENDVSLFLPKTENLYPHHIKHIKLFRFPYFWEDDVEMEEGTECWSTNDPVYQLPGLKIFNFHPIHIFLNSRTMNNYNLLKNEVGMMSVNKYNIDRYINKKNIGTGIFFDKITTLISDRQTFTIQNLHEQYKELIR